MGGGWGNSTGGVEVKPGALYQCPPLIKRGIVNAIDLGYYNTVNQGRGEETSGNRPGSESDIPRKLMVGGGWVARYPRSERRGYEVT